MSGSPSAAVLRSSAAAEGAGAMSPGTGNRALTRSMSSIERRAKQLQALDELLLKGANLETPVQEIAIGRAELFKSQTFNGRSSDPGNSLFGRSYQKTISAPSYNRSISLDGRMQIALSLGSNSNSGRRRLPSSAVAPVQEEEGEGLEEEGDAQLKQLLPEAAAAPAGPSGAYEEAVVLSDRSQLAGSSQRRGSRLARVSTPGDEVELLWEQAATHGEGEEESAGDEDADETGQPTIVSKERRSSSGIPTNPWAPLPGPSGVHRHLEEVEAAAATMTTFDSLRIRS